MGGALDMLMNLLWFLIGLVVGFAVLASLLSPSYLALFSSVVTGGALAIGAARFRTRA